MKKEIEIVMMSVGVYAGVTRMAETQTELAYRPIAVGKFIIHESA